MSKKNRILRLTIISTFIIFFSTYSNVNAYNLDWEAGSIYRFGFLTHVYSEQINTTKGAKDVVDTTIEEEGYYNITALNLLNERYSYIYTGMFGEGSLVTRDFGMDDFISLALSSWSNIMFVEYFWDYGTNTTVLGNFDLGFDPFRFINPDWISFNDAFILLFNESTIIDTVADPYEPVIHNITLGDFLGSLPSYTLNGKNTIIEGKTQFTEDNTAFSFVLDLTGVYKIGIFNSTLGYDVFYPSDKLTFEFSFDYTNGGILNARNFVYDFEFTFDELFSKEIVELKTAYGGLKSLHASFAYLSIIPALLTFVFVVRAAKLRKKSKVY